MGPRTHRDDGSRTWIEDFAPLPYEPAPYVLHHPDGSLAGLVTVHVDDLLWTGGEYEKKMDAIQAKYNFGKVSVNKFAYCGREVLKDERGAHITCPSLMDRVRMIHLTPEGRKKPDMPVSEKLRGQLRGVIGSLAWLARVCRPDLSYAVCKLHSSVHTANINDVKYANKIVELAERDPNKGITYPSNVLKFEDAMIIAMQDASHAADFDMSGSGVKLGHRSQSGRLLCMASRDFKEKMGGVLVLLE